MRVFPHQIPYATPQCHFDYAATRPGYHSLSKEELHQKLAERYLACVENNKDADSLLKALDIVQETNMIASSWRETSSTIIQNCFRKAGFKHHAVDPASETEEDPIPAPAPDVWNRVERWLGDVQFDEFVARVQISCRRH